MIAVGDWARTVSPGAYGWVTYSLLQSRDPVTTLLVRFDGLEQDRLTANDLRRVGASYVSTPIRLGSYALSVEARTAAGCAATIDRPMTVVIQ